MATSNKSQSNRKDVMAALSRRGFLAAGLVGAGALASMPLWKLARAGTRNGNRRFITFFMNGGWDVLLGLDPRDPQGSYAGIDLGTNMLDPQWRTPVQMSIGGESTIMGAPAAQLDRHGDVLTLFRGVNMNTVAHPTGRAYGISMIQPAGTVVTGDALGTRFASADAYDDLVLPNFTIRMPSANKSFPAELTNVGVGTPREVIDLVQVLGSSTDDQTESLLRALQSELDGCVSSEYSGEVPAETLAISRARMQEMLDAGLEADFDLAADSDLMARYAIPNANQLSPETVAATTWRLLETGLTRTVTAELQRGLDTHNANWAPDQPTRLKTAFDALAVLLDDLRMGDPNLENTTVLVYSEFTRTPRINGSQGRDHHFANSYLVFGGGLKPGICGATVQDTLGLLEIDVATGKPQEGGHQLRPEDIAATLAHAAGMDYGDFRTEPLLDWIA